jgi:N-methylhydantoinase A/oxoprolinase/acetone carboxylase beta subunit
VAERRNLAIQKKPDPLIPRDMIVGVKERVDSRGKVIRPLDEKNVREKVRYLVSRGARGFVVSFLWGFLNPIHERRVKEIIRDEYKEFHIGYLPVVLAGQVVGKLGEYERTLAAILDAYLQRSMQIELSAMWDKLRERGYKKPLLMIQSSGGIAEVFRTTASRTFNSGPVSGLMGAQHVAKSLGYQNVVMSDMGGTSFDVGLVVKDSVRSYDFRPIIDRWMVGITMIKTLSIGAGGGSIASINRLLQNRVQVGRAAPARCQARRASISAGRIRRSRTPTWCSDTSILTITSADGCASTRIARFKRFATKLRSPSASASRKAPRSFAKS